MGIVIFAVEAAGQGLVGVAAKYGINCLVGSKLNITLLVLRNACAQSNPIGRRLGWCSVLPHSSFILSYRQPAGQSLGSGRAVCHRIRCLGNTVPDCS